MRLLLPALLVLALGACTSDTSPAPDPASDPAAQPDAPAAASEATPATLWIDVRSAEEFAGGHLPGAINIPHDRIGEAIAGVTGDKSRNITLYCRSGRRAGVALETLQGLGYTAVSNAGGYEALRETQAQQSGEHADGSDP